ncbi:LPS assembly lipoprotein LptE [Spirochaetota bacterium]
MNIKININYSKIKTAVSIFIIIVSACSAPESKDNSKILKVIKSIDGELVVPRTANKIRILPFGSSNKGKEISEKLLISIRKKINLDGRLSVVGNRDRADLKLDGRVRGFQIQPLEYGEYNRPVKQRMRIVVSVRLINLKGGKVIFHDRQIQSFKTFSDIVPPIKTEAEVLESVIEDLAERISRKAVTGWYTDKMTKSERGKK